MISSAARRVSTSCDVRRSKGALAASKTLGIDSPDQIPASRELGGGRRRIIQAGGLSPPLKRRPPTLLIAVQLPSGYELALRFSIRLSTTLGSARVEVSPRLPNSLSAIL